MTEAIRDSYVYLTLGDESARFRAAALRLMDMHGYSWEQLAKLAGHSSVLDMQMSVSLPTRATTAHLPTRATTAHLKTMEAEVKKLDAALDERHTAEAHRKPERRLPKKKSDKKSVAKKRARRAESHTGRAGTGPTAADWTPPVTKDTIPENKLVLDAIIFMGKAFGCRDQDLAEQLFEVNKNTFASWKNYARHNRKLPKEAVDKARKILKEWFGQDLSVASALDPNDYEWAQGALGDKERRFGMDTSIDKDVTVRHAVEGAATPSAVETTAVEVEETAVEVEPPVSAPEKTAPLLWLRHEPHPFDVHMALALQSLDEATVAAEMARKFAPTFAGVAERCDGFVADLKALVAGYWPESD